MNSRIEIAPGVTRHMDQRQAVYTGTPAALVAAGLARAQDLPEKGSRTINSDGTRAMPGRNRGRGNAAGRKVIRVSQRKGGTTAQVLIWLSDDRLDAIAAEKDRAASCWPFPTMNGQVMYLGPRPTEAWL